MCDRDCFNCKYPDCICDEVSEEERKASSRLDSYAKNPDGEEHRAYQRLDYQKHREKRLKTSAEYYQKNKERISEYKKRWYKENKERIREKKQKAKERTANKDGRSKKRSGMGLQVL